MNTPASAILPAFKLLAGARDLLLDEALQALQGVVPLPRDPVEVVARIGEPLRLQLPDVLASAAVAADEAGPRQHVQVLLDRLTGYRGLRAQMRDRFRPARSAPNEQAQPRLVPKRRQEQCRVAHLRSGDHTSLRHGS